MDADAKKIFDSRWKILFTAIREEKVVALTAGSYVPVEEYTNGTSIPSKYRVAFRKSSRWYLAGSSGLNTVTTQMTLGELSLGCKSSASYTVRYYIFNQYIGEVQ